MLHKVVIAMQNGIEVKVLSKMIDFFGNDVKRINHAIKVYAFARVIADAEILTEQEKLSIYICAILHDIGIKESEKKYKSSEAKYQQIEGPPIAREIMTMLHLSDSVIERVCYIIGNHHTYSKVDNIDFQILIEADFLVNIYEENMDLAAVTKIKNKYFNTNAGKALIESMFV